MLFICFPGLKTPASLKLKRALAPLTANVLFSGPKNPGLVEAIRSRGRVRGPSNVFRA